MRTLHVATAQVHSGGGVDDVLKRIEKQVKAASAVGVDVILFTELALHGVDYHMTPAYTQRVAETVDGPSCQRLSELAKTYGIAILAGFIEADDGKYYNSHLVARPDGSRDVQRKHVLTPAELKGGLTPGPKQWKTFEFNGVKTVIVICADTGIEGRHEILREQGIEYQFIPTGGGGDIKDYLSMEDLETEAGRQKYIENRPKVCKEGAIVSEEECPYIGYTSSNSLGPIGEITCHQGHCIIVDNQRVLRAEIPGTIVLEHQQDRMIHAILHFHEKFH